jgi:hypothetical protein
MDNEIKNELVEKLLSQLEATETMLVFACLYGANTTQLTGLLEDVRRTLREVQHEFYK